VSICKEGIKMVLRNLKGKIVLLILLLVFSSTIGWSQTTPEEESIITEDYERVQNVVEGFCQAWKNKDYRVMYEYLSESAKERQSEEKFLGEYQRYELADGVLIQKPLYPLSLVMDGRMLIMVKIESGEGLSTGEATIKTVDLGLIKNEDKAWKIEKIHVHIPFSPRSQ
jgi:hypothetical protein